MQVFGEGQALGVKAGLPKAVAEDVYSTLMGGHIPPGAVSRLSTSLDWCSACVLRSFGSAQRPEVLAGGVRAGRCVGHLWRCRELDGLAAG